ncbi:MAG: hypothetical protein ACI82S_002587 [Patiriisocius sp.]|jgi:hypothetical protein
MQSKGSVILKLEAQWVAISILPILIALVVGGYIAKFKGFGIELEGKLEAPVNSIQLKATDAIEEFPGNEKESMPDLFRVSETHRFAAKRLSFNLDKKNYYGLHAIEEYISALPNIEYFEVKRANGEFVCLLPISLFKGNSDGNGEVQTKQDEIYKFKNSIDDGSVLTTFADSLIKLTVQSTASLIEVLRSLRNNDSEVACVVSKERKLVGVITASLVEKRIADEVIGTKA